MLKLNLKKMSYDILGIYTYSPLHGECVIMIMGSEALETCGCAHDRDQYRDGARRERDSRVFTG